MQAHMTKIQIRPMVLALAAWTTLIFKHFFRVEFGGALLIYYDRNKRFRAGSHVVPDIEDEIHSFQQRLPNLGQLTKWVQNTCYFQRIFYQHVSCYKSQPSASTTGFPIDDPGKKGKKKEACSR